jgi:hypothetical protein
MFVQQSVGSKGICGREGVTLEIGVSESRGGLGGRRKRRRKVDKAGAGAASAASSHISSGCECCLERLQCHEVRHRVLRRRVLPSALKTASAASSTADPMMMIARAASAASSIFNVMK